MSILVLSSSLATWLCVADILVFRPSFSILCVATPIDRKFQIQGCAAKQSVLYTFALIVTTLGLQTPSRGASSLLLIFTKGLLVNTKLSSSHVFIHRRISFKVNFVCTYFIHVLQKCFRALVFIFKGVYFSWAEMKHFLKMLLLLIISAVKGIFSVFL